MRSRKAQCQAPPGNAETGETYEYHSRERRSCAGQKMVPGIEHQNIHRRRSSSSSASIYIIYTRYVCIQARSISPNTGSMEEEYDYGLPSGTCFTPRRLEVVAVAGLLWIYLVVCFFECWVGFRGGVFVFFTSNAHDLLQVRGNLASCSSLLLIVPGCIQGAIIRAKRVSN